MKTILETDRLLIREIMDDDFDALSLVIPKNDGEYILKWIRWCKSSYQKDGFGHYAVILKETGELIGSAGISMQPINNEWKEEIGYHIRKDYQRIGLAKEAATALRDYFFSNFSSDEVYSYMEENNVPSLKTALAMGMKYRYTYKGKDGISYRVYSLTREEWNNLRKGI